MFLGAKSLSSNVNSAKLVVKKVDIGDKKVGTIGWIQVTEIWLLSPNSSLSGNILIILDQFHMIWASLMIFGSRFPDGSSPTLPPELDLFMSPMGRC